LGTVSGQGKADTQTDRQPGRQERWHDQRHLHTRFKREKENEEEGARAPKNLEPVIYNARNYDRMS
jgi:hypothetical protein